MSLDAVLIAGPTASGKSALAMELAEKLGGIIINADSMQVYCELAVLTARPSAADEMYVPHRLYGHVKASERYSVGRYQEEAAVALAEARSDNRVAIFTGGTGLYFKALTQGLSAVPPTPAEVRAVVRARLDAQGAPALHAELARRDPAMAARIKTGDGMVAAVEALLDGGASALVERGGRRAAELTWARTAGGIAEVVERILATRR